MGIVYDEAKKVFRIGRTLASGGQGVVSYLNGVETHCVKVYHRRPTDAQTEKLKLLRSVSNGLLKVAALPTSIAFSDASLTSPIGIFIPFVGGSEIFELYGTRARLQHFPKANFKFLLHAAINLAITFDELHSNGIIIGDVNEQNIKILPDATARLIDCDSFQIINVANVYTSDVGTPIWTPPELQGKNLTGFQRSSNHDLFGLAQLIFLLLFVGRHPFSGVPKSSRQLLPEEAIREFAFAFAPAHLDLPLSPPPGCPPIDAIPANIQQSFMRAFLKGSEIAGARPNAKQWKELLIQLLNSLVACARHSGHVFWKGASKCPWCDVLNRTGVDIFPAPIESYETTNYSNVNDVYVTKLGNLRPHPFNIQNPPYLNLPPEPLPPMPSGFRSSIYKFLSSKSWKHHWLGAALQKNKQTLLVAERTLQENLFKQQAAITTYNYEFDQIRKTLQPLLQQLLNTTNVRQEIEKKVGTDRRQIELNEFLERFTIRTATIKDIKSGRKATLLSNGIETAADVSINALSNVSGFGRVLISQLMNWRNACETQFKFDPSKPLSAHLQQEIERRFQERIKQLKEDVAKCETKLNEAGRHCVDRLRPIQWQAIQTARQRDQAKANIVLIEAKINES